MKKNDLSGTAIFFFLCIALYSCFAGTNNSSSSRVDLVKPSATLNKKPIPTLTQQVVLKACVTSSTIRIREDPGTEFNVIGGLTSGTCFKVLGRNKEASWVYIETNERTRGWVAAWLITIKGDVDRVAVTSNIVSFTPTPNLTNNPNPSEPQPGENSNCLAAYPSVCIPPGSDLDCSDIPYSGFSVPGADPFNFDLDGDGIGCE